MKKLLAVLTLAAVIFPGVVVGRVGEGEVEVDGLKEARREALIKEKAETQAEVVARLVRRMNQINKNKTDAMNRLLERMRALMNKVKAARDKAQTAGKNVGAMNAAITAAETAIGTAQTAVSTQAAKTYSATTKSAFLQQKKELVADLKLVHEKMVAARKAVSSAISSLAKVRGERVPTPTP